MTKTAQSFSSINDIYSTIGAMPAISLNRHIPSTFEYINGVFNRPKKTPNSSNEKTLKFGDEIIEYINQYSIALEQKNVDLNVLESEHGAYLSLISILESFQQILQATNNSTNDFAKVIDKNLLIISSFKNLQGVIERKIEAEFNSLCNSASDETLSELWNHPNNDIWDNIYKKGDWKK